jgi:hypothetical protein
MLSRSYISPPNRIGLIWSATVAALRLQSAHIGFARNTCKRTFLHRLLLYGLLWSAVRWLWLWVVVLCSAWCPNRIGFLFTVGMGLHGLVWVGFGFGVGLVACCFLCKFTT